MRTAALATATILATVALALTGCSNNTTETATAPSDASTTPSTEAATQPSEQTIIDVRTPEEYAAGHLEGAININLQDPSFQTQINTLNKTGTYIVYCRSGNRSAQATTIMTNSGFTNVTDLGSVENASQTLDIAIVN